MADKIDQLKIGTASYDIDLPKDASIDIASALVGGAAVVTHANLDTLPSTGSATVPVYINSSGEFATCQVYGGGTKFFVPGTSNEFSSIAISDLTSSASTSCNILVRDNSNSAYFYAQQGMWATGAQLHCGSITTYSITATGTINASTVVSSTAIATTATVGRLLASSNGSYLGTSSTTFRIYAYSITASYTVTAAYFYATSDARLKTNISVPSITSYTSLLEAVKVREYAWKSDEEKKPNIGVIAQELRDVLPEDYRHEFISGEETEDSHLAVNDSKLVYFAIGAIQEQAKDIAELKKQVKELQEKLG